MLPVDAVYLMVGVSHDVHAVAPSDAAYLPAPHFSQCVPDACKYLPDSHSTHTVEPTDEA